MRLFVVGLTVSQKLKRTDPSGRSCRLQFNAFIVRFLMSDISSSFSGCWRSCSSTVIGNHAPKRRASSVCIMISDAITSTKLSRSHCILPLCSLLLRKVPPARAEIRRIFSSNFRAFAHQSLQNRRAAERTEDELYDVVFTELRSFPFVSFSLSLSLSLLLLLFAPKTVVEDKSNQTNRSLDAEDDVVKVRLLVRVALLQRPIVRERRRPAARRDGPCRHVRIAVLLFACARESSRGI